MVLARHPAFAHFQVLPMPHLPRHARLAAALCLAFACTPTAANAAEGACVPLPTTKAFASVDGDPSDYSPAPGGDFEPGSAAWTMGGAARVQLGNERLGVQPGIRSLRLPLGSSATSPEFCVDETNPHFRFVYKSDFPTLSGFLALVVYRDAQGAVTNVQLTSSKKVSVAPSAWQATAHSPLATLLPLSETKRSATVQIKFLSLVPTDIVNEALGIVPQGPIAEALRKAQSASVAMIAALWSPVMNIGVTIDSVMVDPYRRG